MSYFTNAAGGLLCSPTFTRKANLDKEEGYWRRRAARLPKLQAPCRRLLMCPDNLAVRELPGDEPDQTWPRCARTGRCGRW